MYLLNRAILEGNRNEDCQDELAQCRKDNEDLTNAKPMVRRTGANAHVSEDEEEYDIDMDITSRIITHQPGRTPQVGNRYFDLTIEDYLELSPSEDNELIIEALGLKNFEKQISDIPHTANLKGLSRSKANGDPIIRMGNKGAWLSISPPTIGKIVIFKPGRSPKRTTPPRATIYPMRHIIDISDDSTGASEFHNRINVIRDTVNTKVNQRMSDLPRHNGIDNKGKHRFLFDFFKEALSIIANANDWNTESRVKIIPQLLDEMIIDCSTTSSLHGEKKTNRLTNAPSSTTKEIQLT